MGKHRLSFTERRRASMAVKPRLEATEKRAMITEPISVAALSLGLPLGLEAILGLAGTAKASLPGVSTRPGQGIGAAPPQGGSTSPGANARSAAFLDITIVPRPVNGGGSSTSGGQELSVAAPGQSSTGNDWLNLIPQVSSSSNGSTGLTPPWHPAARQGAGQAIGTGGGGAPAVAATRGAITPLKLAPPSAVAGNPGASAALYAAAASATTPGNAAPPPASGRGSAAPAAQPQDQPQASGPPNAQPLTGSGSGSSSGGTINPNIDPTISNFSPTSLGQFTYFPVYVINYDQGSVLMPGAYQLATFNQSVDLRAQVEGTTVNSISWNTSGLSQASHISGTGTYDLTFAWGNGNTNPSPSVESVTLSVTDINSHTETFTYDFLVPAGTGSGSGGGGATWPTSLPPNLVLDQAPAIDSQNVSVDSTSGALDTSINLPSYNPNLPSLSLAYDSLTANPLPITLIPHTINASLATPSQVSGQITVATTSGTTVYTGSTWYYNTSQFMPGDIQQIALQANMTGQATGRYNYTATVVDYRTTNTTTTITGTMSVLNDASSTIGDGWTVGGLEKITSASGGVILDLGSGGRSLWFSGGSGSGGGTYTDPPGEFSTLTALGSGGGYTRTLTNGTELTFNSSGQETATIDTNGLHITYSYDSGGDLTKITDPYGNATTLTYSGGYLQSIKDPAGRIATFTHSGAELSGVTLPDGSTWGYAYDGSGRLTQVTDPNSKTVTIAYDAAERASTITRSDNTTQTLFPNQEQGWTNSGTSGSPAAATLLATATSTYTDPNGNVTNKLPDWNGQGLSDVYIDPLGNVASYDRNGNGLATVTIDRLNRINQYAYNSQGDITQLTNPDLTTEQYSYNSFSEVTQFTDENGHTYTYTYDSHGNLLVTEDPLLNLTTMTYTADGMLATLKDANNHVTSLQYDSQDRVTTVTNPDGTTDLYGYNSQGNVTSVTDERSNTIDEPRLHLHRRTERRPHARPHDRSGEHRARFRFFADRDADADPAVGRHVHAVGPFAQ